MGSKRIASRITRIPTSRINGKRAFVMTLAVMVVFVTTYILILPAITLEKDTARKQGGIDMPAAAQSAETKADAKAGNEKAGDAKAGDNDAEGGAESVKEGAADSAEPAGADAEGKDKAGNAADLQDTDNKNPEGKAEASDRDGDADKASDADGQDAEKITSADSEDPGKEDAAKGEKKDPDKKELKTGKVAFEGKGFTVEADCGAAAKLPEDTTLEAKQVKPDSKEYDKWCKEALKALQKEKGGRDISGLSFAQFYDISFQSEGEAVEPSAPVNVKISYDKAVKISDADNVRIVHFAVDKKGKVTPEVLDAEPETAKAGKKETLEAASFETASFSMFGVVETETETLETEVLTADGSNYKVSVTYDKDAGVPDGASLKVSEITSEGKSASKYSDYVAKTEKALRIEKGSAENIRLFDIKIVDADGDKVEIAAPVDVKIEMAGRDSDKNAQVVHFADGAKNGEIVDGVKSDGENVRFEAAGFSVYAVVDEESTDAKARMKVEFYNGTTKITTMYVKNDDTSEELEDILYDPGVGTLNSGEIFAGWILDKPNYTSEDVANAMTIEDVRVWAEDLTIKEGETHKLYAAICKLIHINYVDDDEDHTPLGMVSVPVKASEYGTDSVAYTVNMAYTPKDDVHNFEGWILNDESTDNVTSPVPADKLYQNGTDIEIKGDVTFTVNEPAGHWLVFDQNGKGATYNAPQFVKADEVTHQPRPDNEMVRSGYTFGGWYDTKAHADAHAANPQVTTGRFEFGDELETKTTVYASWIPNTTAPYTIILWKQNQSRTAYEVAGSYVVNNGRVGQNIPYSVQENGDEDYVTGTGLGTAGHITGFSIKDADRNQQITITPEGDAVLNLHYDRIEYNFKFYLYRDGTQNNRYDYANNSGSGRSLNDLVTWHSNSRNHPGVTNNSGYTIQSETVGGRTYYYFVMNAYYGEDISSKWPSYDKITGADGREAVSYVMMVGTKLKPNPTSSGSGTVKGLITVLDENILGATNSANGNYVVVRFPDSYYNWRYHIWFETVDGEDYTGKTLHTHEGKTYYEETVLTVRSSNTTDGNQNEPKYTGFEYVTRLGQNDSGTVWRGGHWTTGSNPTLYHLNYIYNRLTYPISYFDGNYVDGSNNTIQNRASNLLHESSEIPQGALIPEADRNYVPDPPEEGYVFEGWYLDEGCTTPYTWSTMPVGGIKVYAKWRKEEFRVFLHPNAGTDPSLDWGDDTVSTCFRTAYGEKVSTPTGKREGSGYEFVGWYTHPSMSSQYLYNSDTVLNHDTVTTPYNQTEETELDDWGNVELGQEGVNKDRNENRFWITKKLDLYAKWRKVLEGSDGINVEYSADDGNGHVGSNPPTDTNTYPDQSEATAQAASTAPAGMEFRYWVIQKWDESEGDYVDTEETVVPGQSYRVDESLAHKVENQDDPGTFTYTMRLRAEYGSPASGLPTHIWWFNNYPDTGSARQNSSYQNEGIKINEAVDILDAPAREGYEFLGWARVQTGTSESAAGTGGNPPTGKVLDLDEDDLYLVYENGQYKLKDPQSTQNGKQVTQIAADERLQYHDMYAVWKRVYKVKVVKKVVSTIASDKQDDVFTFTPSGAVGTETFTLKHSEDGTTGIKEYTGLAAGDKLSVAESNAFADKYDTSVEAVYYPDGETSSRPIQLTTGDSGRSTGEIEVKGDTVITFTNTRKSIPLKVLKVDQERKALAGATFTGDLIDGSYTTVITGTGDDAEAVIIDNSAVTIGNTYTITETDPPAGFNPLEGDVAITVTSADSVTVKIGNKDLTDANLLYKDSEGVWTIKLMDESGVVLPHTGGPGTSAVYLCGLLLLLGAGTVLLLQRRRRA